MKTLAPLFALVLGVTLLASPAWAADTRDAAGKVYVVKDAYGQLVGTASKVLENYRGSADFVVLSLDPGRFNGSDVLVPFSALSLQRDKALVVNLSPELLAQAPAFDPSEVYNIKALDEVYRFYGMNPPWSEEE
ncbi:MAG TPA: hypothetical protein VLS90_19775 [Thermodesulfobacteriota bacterium]|nr:hypothetical protein [Thermodesulfobacteriota bacterium]